MTTLLVGKSARRRLIAGAALGLWVGLCYWLFLLASDWIMQFVTPSNREFTGRLLENLPRMLLGDLYWPSPRLPLGPALCLAFTSVGTVAALLLNAFRVDPEHKAGAALRWAVGVLARSWHGTLLLVLPAAIHATVQPQNASLLFPMWVVLTRLLTIPGIYSLRTAASADGDRWWIPQWPGWRSVGAMVVLLCLGLLAATAAGLSDIDSWWLDLIFVATVAAFSLVIAWILLFHASLRDLRTQLRTLFSPSIYGAWLSCGLTIFSLALPLLLVPLSVAPFDWFVAPEIRAYTGADLPPWTAVVRSIAIPLCISGVVLAVLLDSLVGARLLYLNTASLAPPEHDKH